MQDTTTDSVAAYIITLDPIVRIEADETGPVGWLYSTTGDYVRLSEVIDLAGWGVASTLREVQRLLTNHAEAREVLVPTITDAIADAIADAQRGHRITEWERVAGDLASAVTAFFAGGRS